MSEDISGYVNRIEVTRSLGQMGMAMLNVSSSSAYWDPELHRSEFSIGKMITLTGGYTVGGPVAETIFKGLVMDIRPPERANSRDDMQVKVGTLFKDFMKIPISTLIYENITGQEMLETIAKGYARIPTSYFDFSDDGDVTFTKIAVSESDSATALRKIAQACKVWIYENKIGKLVTKSFPESTTVDFVLSPQDEAEVTHVLSDMEYYNKVRVIGRYKAPEDYEAREVYSKIRTFVVLRNMRTMHIGCEFNTSIKVPDGVDVTLYWTSPSAPNVSIRVSKLYKSRCVLAITRNDDDYFIGEIRFHIVITATPEPGSVDLPGGGLIPGEEWTTRIEGIAEDPDGIIKYKANMEYVVDNEYVESEADAEAVAEQVLKEIKWRKSILQVRMQYDPRFELGDSIRVPYNSVYWRCYIDSITVGWNPASSAFDSVLVCPIMAKESFRLGV